MAKQNEQYEDIFSDSSLSERSRKNKRKKKLKMRFAVIGSITLLLVCGAAAAVLLNSNNIQTKSEEPSAVAEASAESVPAADIEPEISEVSEEEPINFRLNEQFVKNFDLFPKEFRDSLEEEIQSNYVVLYDMTTDQILYDKAGTKKCYPASTTKLMTAVVSSKYLNKNDIITVGDELDLVMWDSSKAGLEKGMKLTYEMLLDALLLPSGNDAAYTIAAATAKAYKGNNNLTTEECVSIFSELMNNAASEMGCKGTHFTVPDGYHDDDHYVTAEDMLRIAVYAQKTPIVMESCKKSFVSWDISALNSDNEESSKIEESSDTESSDETEEEKPLKPKLLEWYNSNRLIEKNGGQYSKYATGMKTGFTDEAWTCVVSSATMSNHTLIAVVLKSPSNYQKYHETNMLFKEAFKLFDLNYTHNDEWVD